MYTSILFKLLLWSLCYLQPNLILMETVTDFTFRASQITADEIKRWN